MLLSVKPTYPTSRGCESGVPEALQGWPGAEPRYSEPHADGGDGGETVVYISPATRRAGEEGGDGNDARLTTEMSWDGRGHVLEHVFKKRHVCVGVRTHVFNDQTLSGLSVVSVYKSKVRMLMVADSLLQ